MAETITFHELIRNINIRDTITMIPANEFINRFIPLHNPYAEFFETVITRSDVVKYNYITRAGDAVNQADYTVEGAQSQPKLDTVKVDGQHRIIKSEWHDGVQYSIKEIQTDHALAQRIEMVAPLTISKNITKKVLDQAIEIYTTYSKTYDAEIDLNNASKDEAMKLLKVILKMADELYQENKVDPAMMKFVIKNRAKDLLLYLNENRGLLGDNSVSQRMKFGEGQLTIEVGGIYFPLTVWQDAYLPKDSLVVLLHKKAMKLYCLGSAEGTSQGTGTYTAEQSAISGIRTFWSDQATKSQINLCVKGSFFGDFIPYTDEKDEADKKSRWMWYIKNTKKEEAVEL